MSSRNYVSEQDLQELVRDLRGLDAQLGDGRSWSELEGAVWKSYVKIEAIVTKMKLRMAIEKPGEFIEVSVRDPITKHIAAALASAEKGEGSAAAGEFTKALSLLRDCRNELRAFLESASKARLSQARKELRTRTPSSWSSSKPSSPS